MKNIKLAAEYYLVKTILLGIKIMPRKIIRALGGMLGYSVYLLDKKHRNLALSNLTASLVKGIAPGQRKIIIRRSFIHFGRSFFDMIYLSEKKPEKRNSYLTIEGLEHITSALEQKKGALLFSAHFGIWEIAPALISQLGIINVIARPLDNPRLEQELLQIRKNLNSVVIYKYQASRAILRCLRSNEMVAILIDQNALRKEAVFVDFFGRQAATTPALATFSLRTGAPIIPVFCYPTGPRTYHIKIMPSPKLQLSGDSRRDTLHITQICTAIVEEQIRLHPEYWFWFHNRWRTRPVSEE